MDNKIMIEISVSSAKFLKQWCHLEYHCLDHEDENNSEVLENLNEIWSAIVDEIGEYDELPSQ